MLPRVGRWRSHGVSSTRLRVLRQAQLQGHGPQSTAASRARFRARKHADRRRPGSITANIRSKMIVISARCIGEITASGQVVLHKTARVERQHPHRPAGGRGRRVFTGRVEMNVKPVRRAWPRRPRRIRRRASPAARDQHRGHARHAGAKRGLQARAGASSRRAGQRRQAPGARAARSASVTRSARRFLRRRPAGRTTSSARRTCSGFAFAMPAR